MALGLAFVWGAAAHAQDARDANDAGDAAAPPTADFAFIGPLPVRNFAPIQLIFLNLPFERALAVPPETFAFHLWVAESNEIATTQGQYNSNLKFETTWTVLGTRYGVAPNWEVGVDLPLISRWGGFLDPMINGVETAFGRENVERKLYPDNAWGGFQVQRGDAAVFQGGNETLEPGDLWFSAKRELHVDPQWPLLALRAGFKVPTGSTNEVNGSGKPDFGIGLAGDYRAWERLMLYMNVDLIYPIGPITDANLSLSPFMTESFGAEVALNHWITAQLHQAAYGSPMLGTGTELLSGTVVELGLGLGLRWNPHLDFQLMGIDNVSGVEQAADFTLLLATTVRP